MTDDSFVLPTGKPNISFSELSDWKACTWRHKLKYIDKIEFDRPSPYTVFGSAVHESCEAFLRTRAMDPEIAVKYIRENWKGEEYGPDIAAVADWCQLARDILADVPAFMDKEFPDWEFVAAEQQLFESIEGHEPVKFKGFIDGVIAVPDSRGNKKLWLVDWKTAGWGWSRDTKSDFVKQAQLRLYKHFWSKKANVPMKDIRCAFVLLKRGAKNGNRCEAVTVSVGDKTMKRTLDIVNNMVGSMKKGIALKNRNSCKWCDYKDTEHCP